jgi:aspartyl-tRNA(Asn)/glutamyl-tRNA(Gln) amidotransferase subunit A
MTNSDICRLSALEVAAAVRAKKLSAGEVVSAALEHIERLEPEIHAFCTPMPDQARAATVRIDKLIADGADPGPLAGVPVAIKDTILVAGVPCVQGSVAYADFVPEEDDIVVERLKAAGAIVVGKTNVPEFAYAGVGHNPVFETTRGTCSSRPAVPAPVPVPRWRLAWCR